MPRCNASGQTDVWNWHPSLLRLLYLSVPPFSSLYLSRVFFYIENMAALFSTKTAVLLLQYQRCYDKPSLPVCLWVLGPALRVTLSAFSFLSCYNGWALAIEVLNKLSKVGFHFNFLRRCHYRIGHGLFGFKLAKGLCKHQLEKYIFNLSW